MSGLGNWRDIPRMMYHLEYALGKEDKVRNWKCEYCASANFPEKLDCRSCGAPQPDKAELVTPWFDTGYNTLTSRIYKCNTSQGERIFKT